MDLSCFLSFGFLVSIFFLHPTVSVRQARMDNCIHHYFLALSPLNDFVTCSTVFCVVAVVNIDSHYLIISYYSCYLRYLSTSCRCRCSGKMFLFLCTYSKLFHFIRQICRLGLGNFITPIEKQKKKSSRRIQNRKNEKAKTMYRTMTRC